MERKPRPLNLKSLAHTRATPQRTASIFAR